MSDAGDELAYFVVADQSRKSEAESFSGIDLCAGQGFSVTPRIGLSEERSTAAQGDGLVFLRRNGGLFEFGLGAGYFGLRGYGRTCRRGLMTW